MKNNKAKKLIAIYLTSIMMLGFGFGAQNVLADWTTGKFDSAMDFNGTSDFIFAGDIEENVKTILFWIKADSTTDEKIIDLDAGTHYIKVLSGTLSAPGFADPVDPIIYVDGVVGTTIDTNWHFVAITTTTAIDANSVYLGRVFITPDNFYFNGVLDDVRFYDRVLTAKEVAEHYRQRSPSLAQGGTISASSAYTALTITQSGTGNLVDLTGDSITTGTGLSMSVGGLSSGSGIAIDSSSTAGDGYKLLNLTSSGAVSDDKTRYGAYSSMTGTGAGTATNYAGYFSATGAVATNIGGYFTATGATNNYGLIVPAGYVGIGVAVPSTTLHVAGQCVTADTRLRRRRKKKPGEKADPEKGEWEDDPIRADDSDESTSNGASEYIYGEVMIKDIQPGDEIASMDPITGELVYSQVKGLMNMGIKPLYRLTTQSGRQIRTTENHPYFVRTEYEEAAKQPNQKLVKFEVDQSIRIEQYAKDTIIAIANKENKFSVVIPRKVKQNLRDNLRKYDPKKFTPIMFALGVVSAIEQSKLIVHELAIDIEYPGHEDIITEIISRAFPKIEIDFTQVGKKSPAHYFAYSVYKNKKTADFAADINDMGHKAENALGAVTHPHIRRTIRRTWTSLVTNSIDDNKKLVKGLSVDNSRLAKSGQWTKVKGLKVGQMIAVTHGNRVVWEKIVKIKQLPAERVYDIEVEGTHNFVANGIIAHNTYINVNDAAGLKVEDSAGNTNVLVVDTASGRVGVGTDTPLQKLHVAGRLATDDKISEGLVGSWHFDEATSGNAHGLTLTDDSGYGNDGTGAGTDGPTWTTGKFGGALDFETDNDQYVEISPIIELADDNSWSVVLYVKLESSGDRGFCGNTDTVGNYSKIYFWSNAWLDIRVVNNTDEYAGWHLDFENWIGTWAHLAFICDGSDSSNIEFFIDGTSKGKQTLADSALTIKRIASMGSTTFSCFDGLIDEPRIYKRALTADEIQQQYNAGIWKYGTGGIAYMDGNVGIGDASPLSLLTVGTSDAFQVDSSGNLTFTGSPVVTINDGGTMTWKDSGDNTLLTLTDSGTNGLLTVHTIYGTTFDTNVAAAGVTLTGTALAADGTDTNIDIDITPQGTGEVNIIKIDIDSGAIDGTAIGAVSPSTGAFTTLTATPATDVSGLEITRNVAPASSSLLSITESNLSATGTGLVISQAGTAAKVATFAGPGADGTVNLVEISGTTTGTGLTVTQSGTGYIFDLKDGADSVFTVADNGEIFASATTSGNPYSLIADEATTNLVLNPSFEYGTYNENWTAVASATPFVNGTYYHAGTHSMKVVTPNSAANEGVQHAAISVSVSTAYISSAFLKGTGTVELSLTGDNSGATATDAINLTDDWTRYFISKTTDASDTTLTLKILTPTQQLATFYIDAVQLEAKSAMTTYCDGSLGEGYSWSSTAHNSSSSRTAGMRFKNNATGFALNDEGRLDVSGLTVSQKGSADGEIFRVSGGADSILSVNQAIVEINQPLAVNVAGDVGINYDLYFAGTGTSNITSAGPLVIAAGDPNHSENLTITTGGSGDVIVDIVDSTFGFKVLGVHGGYVFRILPSGDLDIHSVASNLNTPFGGFGQYQNLLTYSEELNNAAWTKTTLTTATNSVAAPDGQNTADTLTSTSNDGDIEQDYDTNADISDRSFIFSVWLRAASAVTSRLKIISSSDGAADGTTLVSETRPVTIEWQRFYVKGTFGTVAAADKYVKAQIVPIDGSTGAVYAWGAQLEEASDAGVYAYTTSSVVAADEGLLAKNLKLSGDIVSDGTLTAGGSGTSYIYDSLNIGTDTTAGTVDMGAGADADLFVSDDLEIEGGLFVEGETTFTPSTTQVIDAVGDTILANATVIVLNPDGDYTMTSAPTIADGITGQVLYITCANGEANTVTVQDQDTLASSNLQLGDTTRAISGKDVLQLMFDGTNWIEVSFANN